MLTIPSGRTRGPTPGRACRPFHLEGQMLAPRRLTAWLALAPVARADAKMPGAAPPTAPHSATDIYGRGAFALEISALAQALVRILRQMVEQALTSTARALLLKLLRLAMRV